MPPSEDTEPDRPEAAASIASDSVPARPTALRRLAASRLARFALVLALVSGTVAVVYGGPIRRNFGKPQWEDQLFFRHDRRFIHSAADSFRHGSFWKGLYRPLSTNLYYHLGRNWFHNDLRIYHALNALLFVANILLAFWVCRSLAGYWASLVVALLFGSRLASSEVMLYTSQMQSLLPVLFSLLALKAYLVGLSKRCHPALMITASVLVLAALLSKESAVTLPFVCLLFALLMRPSGDLLRSRRTIARALWALLPLVSLAVWWLIARKFLQISNNRWWSYELSPLGLAANGVAYLLSFSNAIMWRMRHVKVPGKTTWLQNFPALKSAHASTTAQLVFLLLVAVCAGFLLAVIIRRRWNPPRDLVLAAVGFALFLGVTAPMLIFHNRMLTYYGYFGHFGTSLMLVGLLSPPARRAGRLIRRRGEPAG